MCNSTNPPEVVLAATVWPNATADSFAACVATKNRLRIGLTVLFFAYYLALQVCAGWFRSVLATPVISAVNLGMVFTLSQYLFGAVVAIYYARRMRVIDERIATVLAAGATE
jgi:uncharacterized membrane protein (DUF485 family)